ncbi:hypothetical protein Ate02nite_15440 [Paractinoplanes tereljensis]|uniref:Transposase n=1 Tax=Paractinoplanes tereljensis TaxID=571912 RepID=A0A919TR41_9ACTN|nr:hypothetical protein Ate02nite_15440 [Actinoplanes tereljensis]
MHIRGTSASPGIGVPRAASLGLLSSSTPPCWTHSRAASVKKLFTVPYRDVEELLAERGIRFDHATVYRWVHGLNPPAGRCSHDQPTYTGRSVQTADVV